MEPTVQDIKSLREETGAGVMDCKRALSEANGNMDKAREILRQQGIASASKRSARATNEGLIESYIHAGGRIGALIEINCETDFVARTEDFRGLAHDLAMQVAAMAPESIDVPDDGAPEHPVEAYLMQQSFIKDPSKTIKDLVSEAVGRLGENIQVKRFTRFSLGE